MAGSGISLRPVPALLALAFLALGGGMVATRLRVGRAAALTPEDLVAADRVALVASLPGDPELMRTLGARFEKALFPPDLAAARAAAERRIALDPFDSAGWLRLARLHYRAGRREEALAALRASDHLKPGFPAERLDAIQLWALLGERDRARKLAAQVAALGDEPSLLAARELRVLGWDPRDAMEVLAPGRSALAQARIAVLFFGTDPIGNAELLGLLPPAVSRDAAARRVLFEATLSPLLPEQALALWKQEAGERLVASEATGGTVWLDAPRLAQRPGLRQPLGWQLTQDAAYLGGEEPSLRVLMQSPRGFTLPVYRLLLPAGTSAMLVLDVEVDATAPARVQLAAGTARGEPLAATGRLRLRVPLAAGESACLADVTLACLPEDPRRDLQMTEVRIRGIALEPAP
jgi:tetratricopeptide (TPR) repeat protein